LKPRWRRAAEGALARAFKTGEFAIPDDLPALITAAGAQCARSAGTRVALRAIADRIGQDRDGGALGTAARLYHATDAGEDGCRKLAQAWRVGSDREGSDLKVGVARHTPGVVLALGRDNVVTSA
jgi:hypothetical protein